MLQGVIMAGGGGTRFWPRSRALKPKQFLHLAGDRTLLQMAWDRLRPIISPDNIWVITSSRFEELVQEQLPQIPRGNIVGEPVGRDTAACIALGAALVAQNNPQATMVVTPADHVIEPLEDFTRGIQLGEKLLRENPGYIVLFGIKPTFPATGYGYIQQGPLVKRENNIPIHRVAAFREKPSYEIAEGYLQSGEFSWNSGIFMWPTPLILEAIKKQAPTHYHAAMTIAGAWGQPEKKETFQKEYDPLKKISIDYAVMEHARDIFVVDAPFKWDDVGSWLAIERMNTPDREGNTIQGLHCGLRTQGCIVVGEPGKLITTIGLSNLLIIQDGDAILVADKRDESAVKNLVDLLREKGMEQYL